MGEMNMHGKSPPGFDLSYAINLMERLRHTLQKEVNAKRPFPSEERALKVLLWRVIEWTARMAPATRNAEETAQSWDRQDAGGFDIHLA